jgi:hypothetical protein
MKELVKMAINFSRRALMVLVAIIAGTLHPKPRIIGIKERPEIPNR